MKKFQILWIILFLLSSFHGLKGQGVGGFWMRENAKQNEPFLLLIDSDQKLIQIVYRNNKTNYNKQKPLRYQKSSRSRRNDFQIIKSNISFNWVNDRYGIDMSITPKKRKRSSNSSQIYRFKRPAQLTKNIPTEGSIYFTNYTQSSASLFYITKKKKLLIKKIPKDAVYFQPTQRGMNWRVEANRNKPIELVAEARYDVLQSIGEKPFSPYPTKDKIDYEEMLSSTIWVNRNAGRGTVESLVIGKDFSQAGGIRKSNSALDPAPVSGVGYIDRNGENTYSIDASTLKIKFSPKGDSPYLEDIRLSVSEGRSRAVLLENLESSNVGRSITLENKLYDYVNLYYICDGIKVYFYRLASKEIYILNTLKTMNWKLESRGGYNRGLAGQTQENWIQLTEDDIIYDNEKLEESKPVKNRPDEVVIIKDDDFPTNNEQRGQDSYSIPDVSRPTRVILGNSLNFSIEVFAINSNGQETSYGILEPGQIDHFPSFVNQMWEAKSVSGKPISWYIVPKEKDKNFFR